MAVHCGNQKQTLKLRIKLKLMKRSLSFTILALLFSFMLISCGSTKVEPSEKKHAPTIVLKDFFISENTAEYSEKIKKLTSIKTGYENKYRIFFVVSDPNTDVKAFYTSFDNFEDPAKTTRRTIDIQTMETEWFCWQNVFFESEPGKATFYAYAEDSEGNKSNILSYNISITSE